MRFRPNEGPSNFEGSIFPPVATLADFPEGLILLAAATSKETAVRVRALRRVGTSVEDLEVCRGFARPIWTACTRKTLQHLKILRVKEATLRR